MNYERKVDSMDSLASGPDSFYEEADSRRKRTRLIVALVLSALALAATWYAFSSAKGGAADASGAADGNGAASIPNITVVIPGRQSVQATIRRMARIAARREMPVGVAGEGGQVVRVLVRPASGC